MSDLLSSSLQASGGLDPSALDLLDEAQQRLSILAQLDLAQALTQSLLEDPRFLDSAEAELIMGLDYIDQGLSDLRR